MGALLRRLRARLKYRHFERELADEIETHRALAEADLQARGLPADEARPAAARLLGNVTYMREEARAVWIARWAEQVWQDLRYAGRQCRRQPGFAVTAVLTLGVALGLLTGVFAVYSALYLRPWEVADPDTVFLVRGTEPPAGNPRQFTPAAFERLRMTMTTADVVAFDEVTFRLDTGAGPNVPDTPAVWASRDFLETIRVPLHLGTGFGGVGEAPAVVISHDLWRSRFGERADILGMPLAMTLRSTPPRTVAATIVGVLPRGFRGLAPLRFDVVANLASRESWEPGWSAPERDSRVMLAGRVRHGHTRERAMAELAAIGPAALTSEQLSVATAFAVDTTFTSIEGVRRTTPRLFLLLFAATGLIVALACANVGNLQLARGVRRQRELAIRLSLGAGRARVMRQLLTESLAMTVTAAVLGLAIATVVPAAVLQVEANPPLLALTPDHRTFTFMTTAAVLACALFAVAPSFRFSRSARLTTGPTAMGAGRLRSIILAVQVATSVAIVSAAALLTRGVVATATSDGGFALQEVVVGSILNPSGVYDAPRNAALLEHLRGRFASEPHGTFGLTEHPPLSSRSTAMTIPDAGRIQGMAMNAASFEALGIPLLAGRIFSDTFADREVVVNEALATRLWPGASALGRTLGDRVVVGVAGDARLVNVTVRSPLYFRPLDAPSTFFVTFRANAAAEQTLRQAIADFDSRLTVRVAPLASEVMDDLQFSIVGASLAGGLAVLALLLSIVGVFGVAAFIVEERRREIGVRLALGAKRFDIRRALFAAAQRPLAGGLVVGVLLSVVGGFLLRAFLLDVSPVDPLSYFVVGVLVLGSAGVATWVPMRRALRVDPAVTLRSE